MKDGWLTSIGAGGRAHLYENDVPVCAAGGETHVACFTRPVRPATLEDHHCTYCAEHDEVVCVCWKCIRKAESAVREAVRRKAS